MRTKYKNIIGRAEFFNPCNLREIIFHPDEGEVTSIPIDDAYVFYENKWVKMTSAFRKKIITADKYMIRFDVCLKTTKKEVNNG